MLRIKKFFFPWEWSTMKSTWSMFLDKQFLFISLNNLSNLKIWFITFWSLYIKSGKYYLYKYLLLLFEAPNKSHTWNFGSIWYPNTFAATAPVLLRDLKGMLKDLGLIFFLKLVTNDGKGKNYNLAIFIHKFIQPCFQSLPGIVSLPNQ